MSLITTVLAYVDRARSRPAQASDPEELKALEHAARGSWGNSFAAMHAPVAEYTWETRALLPGASETSERATLVLSALESEIVGFYVSLSFRPNASGERPTIDDIDVSIDYNDQNKLTSSQTTMSRRDGSFVSLGSIGIQGPRLFAIRFEGPNPTVGFTFRWKWGVNVYVDTMIGIAAYVRHMREDRRFR